MGYTCNLTWEPLRSFDTSTVSSDTAYYNLGGPLLHPSYKLKMVNLSNVNVLVSINGTSAVDVCPAGGFWLYDETQAQFPSSTIPSIPQGTQISINSAAGAGTGLVYLVSQYIVQN
jgi:hypothetical protein